LGRPPSRRIDWRRQRDTLSNYSIPLIGTVLVHPVFELPRNRARRASRITRPRSVHSGRSTASFPRRDEPAWNHHMKGVMKMNEQENEEILNPHCAGATCCDRKARGRAICSTKAHSRVIDSIPVRPCLVAGWRTKPGRPAFHRGEGSGSDALCCADDPASGAGPCWAAGSRASSGLEPCESEPLRLPGGTTISTISLRRLVHNAG